MSRDIVELRDDYRGQLQYINPCWQPIDLDWATVIGVTSFLAEDIYNPDRANCVDRSGIPLSYFADVQAGWDWIYETIEGKKLISPAYIYPK